MATPLEHPVEVPDGLTFGRLGNTDDHGSAIGFDGFGDLERAYHCADGKLTGYLRWPNGLVRGWESTTRDHFMVRDGRLEFGGLVVAHRGDVTMTPTDSEPAAPSVEAVAAVDAVVRPPDLAALAAKVEHAEPVYTSSRADGRTVHVYRRPETDVLVGVERSGGAVVNVIDYGTTELDVVKADLPYSAVDAPEEQNGRAFERIQALPDDLREAVRRRRLNLAAAERQARSRNPLPPDGAGDEWTLDEPRMRGAEDHDAMRLADASADLAEAFQDAMHEFDPPCPSWGALSGDGRGLRVRAAEKLLEQGVGAAWFDGVRNALEHAAEPPFSREGDLRAVLSTVRRAKAASIAIDELVMSRGDELVRPGSLTRDLSTAEVLVLMMLSQGGTPAPDEEVSA